MKKLLLGFVLLLIVVGCANVEKTEEVPQSFLAQITYSNLNDENSREILIHKLQKAEFNKKEIDNLVAQIIQFNQIVGTEVGLVLDFATTENIKPAYDEVKISEQWEAKYPLFLGENCRITAFRLFKKFLSFDTLDKTPSRTLMLDNSALDDAPKSIFSDQDRKQFETFFSSINAENTKNIQTHLQNVQESWHQKGIKFLPNKNASLVTVWFHDTLDNILFIGHTGILIKQENGFLFFEKLAFQEPYQLLKFANLVELNDYLMNKYDISWGQPEAKPFIMINDKLIKGYRENQNNKKSNS